jgi:arginyl-tRNA synthetase
MQTMRETIRELLYNTIAHLSSINKLPAQLAANINVELPRNKEHGDFSTNIAMLLAKETRQKPLDIAKLIIENIPKVPYLKSIEAIPPGFINFRLSDAALHTMVQEILAKGKKYGWTDIGKDKSALVEFVSANPTGPLHVGHGRGAAYGDTVANLLETMGYQVKREYYVNDAGRQMHVLALSIWLRYLELSHKELHFPASSYRGAYVIEIAERLKVARGESLLRPLQDLYENLPADEKDGGDKEFYVDAMVERAKQLLGHNDYNFIFQEGIKTILADIREDLEEFGVVIQEWFHESHLIENKDVENGIELLKKHGHVYSKDGALWFKATDFNDEKDRVLVRSNGQTTYFASDVGYHLNKYQRGYDLIIDVFGADHHGYAPRIKAFLKAMDLDLSKLHILLVQFAILYRGKQKVSMSTRGGEFVTLRTLREEVGTDVARFFYLMRKNDQHLDFDLELAKSESMDNPMYYIQYAHARICSVMRQLNEKQITYDAKSAVNHLALLTNEHERQLMQELLEYDIILQTAALNYEPHILAYYLRKLASTLHTYYGAHQFLVEDHRLCMARLYLIDAVRQVLANGLELLGVAPKDAM